MNNQPNASPGKTGRHSHASSGKTPDFQIHQSDADIRTDNLKTLIIVGATIAGAVALAIGLFGRKRVQTTASKLAQTTAQDAKDDATQYLHEDQILARKPEIQKDPTLAARLVALADGEKTVLVFKVEKKKGQRARITRRQRGRVVIGDTANNLYLFAVSGPEPIVFSIHDVRNMFDTLSGPCLAVGEA